MSAPVHSAPDQRTADVEALRAARKNLRSAFWAFAFAAALVALVVHEYLGMERLIRSGRDGIATVVNASDMLRGRKGTVSYSTEIELDGVRTKVRLPFRTQNGQRFRVIYRPESLADWASHRKGWFYDYALGSSSEGAWEVYNSNHPTTLTYGKWVFGGATLAICFFVWSYFRERPF